MAVPRPLLLALLGTILLVATFMATRATRDNATENAAAPAPAQPAPAPGAQPPQTGALSPADAAKAITSPGKPLTSARFDVRFSAAELGGKRDRETLELSGSFDRTADTKVPSFDLKVVEGENGRRSGTRVLSTGDKGFLFKGATAFPVPDRSIRGLGTMRTAIAEGNGDQTTAPPPLEVLGWLDHPTAKPAAKLDGVGVTHLSGRIDPARASDGVAKLYKSIGAAADEPSAVPKGIERKVQRALKSAKLDAYVGTEDRILRRLRIGLTGVLPKEALDRGETGRWRILLDAKLSQVNRPQRIQAPDDTGSRSPRRALGAAKARNDAGVLTLGALAFDPPAGFAQSSAGFLRAAALGRANRTPRAVARAIRADKKVVIFFEQPNGVDDPVTAHSVSLLRKRSKAVTFTDDIANASAYGRVVQSVGVTRAPSIVIVGRKGRARLIEGYIDPDALAQEVADTR